MVDAESGEVLLQKWEDDIAQALAAGEKSMQATFRITVDEREDGTACCHTFATEDGYLEAVWKKPRRRRAQRYRFVMLYFEKVLALGPRERESLLQIAPNIRRDGKLMRGVRALDAEGLADLWQVGRSAANGVGDYFHRIWKQAESGESPFVPLFFPWFMLPEYRMKPPADFQVTDEEAELQEKFSLDESQLAWRRWCITANCGGDVNKFHQEYPSTPNEAFLFSGRPVFDVQAVEAAMNSAKPAAFIGSVQREGSRLRFRTEPYGCLKVWEKPEDGEDYIIGIDVAEGRVGGDFSVMSVFRHRTMEQVAEWHGHCFTPCPPP